MMMQQQMMMAQAGMVNVTVPEGKNEGDFFKAKMPDGQIVKCQVPPGAGPGAVIQVKAPPPKEE